MSSTAHRQTRFFLSQIFRCVNHFGGTVIHHQLLSGQVFRTFGTHSVRCGSGYPLENVMAASCCPKFTKTYRYVFPAEHTSASGQKKCLRNPPPNSFSPCDYKSLSSRNGDHLHDPLPGLQIKLQGGMALHQTDDQFTRSLDNPSGNVDK